MTSGFCRLTLAAVLLVLTACGGPDPTTPPDDPLHPSAVCGDGTKASSEACDDGNTTPGDGCNATCAAVETGYACDTAGRACVRLTCGDGRKTGSEVCDDGNGQSLDGCALDCSAVEAHYTCATPGQPCTVEPGWTCTGGACRAAACGDGLKVGDEECEDGNAGSGDGCSAACRLESGYKCPTVGQPCEHTVCGDGVPEGTEQCDDGDNDMGDGCSPLCVNEPRCSGGTCTAVCGDNVILPGAPADECDDGNTRSGDGCSADCKLEPDSGFQCTTIEQAPPDTVELPVVYRDFVAVGLQAGSVPTHPDFNDANGAETGIVGALYTGALSADGKPTYAKEGLTSATTHGKARFDQWYRDVPGVNLTRVSTLSLARQSSGAYLFDDQTFFPLDGLGWVAEGAENTAQNSDTGAQAPRNFGFTSEARYWFEFKGTEKLDFRGDDDVWVYINGRLALDLGGVHGAADGTVDLSSTTVATNLGLVRGRIYEVVVFQAERHVTRSSYKLTLNNFVTRRTECVNLCGNGTVEGSEQCDAGRANNTGGYGHCSPTCTQGPRCGDGVTQSQFGEQCDDANTVDNDSCNNLCRVSIG